MNSPHFSDAELACHCGCGVNACKPELVFALEALRSLVGIPIRVDDAYRCPAHNAAVGGVKDSEHLEGIAADIRIPGMSPDQMYAAARCIPAFANGGIGVSQHQGYIHVDTRGAKARWCYDVDGKACAWNL